MQTTALPLVILVVEISQQTPLPKNCVCDSLIRYPIYLVGESDTASKSQLGQVTYTAIKVTLPEIAPFLR